MIILNVFWGVNMNDIIIIIAGLLFFIYILSWGRTINDEVNKIHQEMRYETKKKTKEPEKYLTKEMQHLDTLYRAKESYCYKLINKKFKTGEMSYDRYITCLANCRKYFEGNMKRASETYGLGVEKLYIFKAKEMTKEVEKLMIELVKYDENKDSDDKIILEELEHAIRDVKEYEHD